MKTLPAMPWKIVAVTKWWLVVVAGWTLAVPSAKCLDLDEGGAACNVHVATADNWSATNAPLALRKLQKQFTHAGIKSQFAHQDRSANAEGKTTDDWFLCVYPGDVEKARKLVDDAIHAGLHLSADHTPPIRSDT